MRSKTLWLILILSASYLSCHKDISQGKHPPKGNQLLAKQITQLPNFLLIDSFVYDSQNRCTRIYVQAYDSSAPALHIAYDEFHYYGNDTLPYKITDSSQFGKVMNWWIQYDALGRKLSDSMLNYGTSDKRVSHYTYSSNRIFVSTIAYQTYGPIQYLKDTFDFNGNNCLKYKALNDWGGGTPYWWQYAMTYDHHPSPQSMLNIAPAAFFGGTVVNGWIEGLNKNNILASTFTSSDPRIPVNVKTYQYIYDLNGNPVYSSSTSSAYPTQFEKVTYQYTR